ncbi:MAG: hypothetical protein RLZZ569_1283, partial [Bacteroidota bacterium]
NVKRRFNFEKVKKEADIRTTNNLKEKI